MTLMVALLAALAGGAGTQSGCSLFGESPAGGGDAGMVSDAGVASALIGPAGGELEVPGAPPGSRLIIPPGALDEETEIRVVPAGPSRPYRLTVKLEPEGLVFAQPVIFDLAHGAMPDDQPPVLRAIQASDLNPLVEGLTETTNWQTLEVVGYDPDRGVWSLELNHFSFLNALWDVQDMAYVVVDIPDRYLRPGDMLVTLTGLNDPYPSWNTGHVGLYRGEQVVMDGLKPAGRVIESNTNSGVHEIFAENFRTIDKHLYVGARQPPGALLTDQQRYTVVDFAHTQQVNGAGYSIAGFGALDNFSCVGLVEKSWDEVSRGLLGFATELTGGTPYDMYEDSEPVDRVVVVAEEPLDLLVYGVEMVVNHNLLLTHYSGGGYQKLGNVEVTGLPPGATFDSPWYEFDHHLLWTPTPDQIGEEYVVDFTMADEIIVGGKSIKYNASASLTLVVAGYVHDFTVVPSSATVQGYTYAFYQAVPATADIRSTSFVDVETGLPAEQTVFPNHTFAIHHQGWSETYPGKYGITFQVRNPDGGAVNVPNRTWRWAVNHTLGEWRGDLTTPPPD